MKRILIIDDTQADIDLMFYQVSHDYPDAEIVATTDPEIALGYADSNKIDMAIFDMCMPKINGYDLFEMMEDQIKAVVFISAQPKALQLSNGHAKLEKPFKMIALKDKIDDVTRKTNLYEKVCELERLIIGRTRYNVLYG